MGNVGPVKGQQGAEDIEQQWEAAGKVGRQAPGKTAGEVAVDTTVGLMFAGLGTAITVQEAKNALALMQGRDGIFFKPSQNPGDRVVGTALHGVLTAVGAAGTAYVTYKVASNIASFIEKKG